MQSLTKRRIPVLPVVLVLIILALVSVVFSLGFGSEQIPLDEIIKVLRGRLAGESVDSPVDTIIWDLRMPRALLALTAGAGLSIAGAGMQTMVRNPLADPYLLGISAGASVGATAVITMGLLSQFGVYALSVGALLGALGSAVAVYLVAQAQGGLTPLRMVLAGVVMSAAFSSIASFMVFLSDDNRAANSVMFWMLGSVAGATWERLILPVIVVVIVSVGMLALSGWLDALAAGPETAAALGIRVNSLRNGLFVALGILVGVIVAVSGGIGFVGLIVPHAARMIVGALHRRMLLVTAFGGAIFLLWVDVLSRVIARPQEIPLGVVTGVIGAPIFLMLMGRTQYAFGGRDR
ncbi:MAG: sugar ABC transporter substrate-binding protein [Propionibacterium sp.]|nr:MAG: sugar ABC transporter substrate-binding protein [Propionibacterium sp.]